MQAPLGSHGMSVPGQKGQDSGTLVSWLRGTNIDLLQVTVHTQQEVGRGGPASG